MMKMMRLNHLMLPAILFCCACEAFAEDAKPNPVVMGGTAATPEAILTLMHRVNDWQIAHPYQKSYKDCNWIRGTWYTGVMAAYRATGDKSFFDQGLAWAKEKKFGIGYERSGLNRLFPADSWCELAMATGDKRMVEKVVTELDTPGPNTPVATPVWYLEDGRRYADSLFGMPVLAKLTQITGDRKYVLWMDAFFRDVDRELWDSEEHFYYRDKRFIGVKTVAGKKSVWSRGSGWGYAAIARVLEVLPANDPTRPRFVERFKQFSIYVASTQQADGLWRPNMADPADFPMPETSGTAFFCFGLLWGINNGILDRATYAPVARKAWAGLVSNISGQGKVLYGQTVGFKPAVVNQEDSHEYVTGAFLLAASEMYKLAVADKAP